MRSLISFNTTGGIWKSEGEDMAFDLNDSSIEPRLEFGGVEIIEDRLRETPS